ncbi:uncharacterized protein E0L32_002575 [Thyridium curvatum]|uniref:Uncharacterized protein n=1 Tax=Thyridium curvatum TaxID=1093900 RepID=A0A507BPJ4_9PEZI|nr:uncharacterized protein E0L32_002575 [Thyridium curvatum]TPX18718.1 hypothetical protein E0L32_002575 [Thyridium curvatum]
MTTKILNQTWFDRLRTQYEKDSQDDTIVFPLTYILYSNHWKQDLSYEVKHRITLTDFLKSLGGFRIDLARTADGLPFFEDQNLKIKAAQYPKPKPSEIHWITDPASEPDSEEEQQAKSKAK